MEIERADWQTGVKKRQELSSKSIHALIKLHTITLSFLKQGLGEHACSGANLAISEAIKY